MKRGAIIGIGTVLLVIGLTGLGLLQTGVIYPPASTGPVSLPEVTPPEPAAGDGQQSRGQVGQSAQKPAQELQAGVPPTNRGSGLASTQVEQQPQSGGQAGEKPVPVPQVGQSERRYPGQDRLAQPAAPRDQVRKSPSRGAQYTGKPKFDEKRLKAKLKSETKRYAGKPESKSYARKVPAARKAQPVVIRFNFDPSKNRRLNVAQVHLGDKIRVKVRQVGQVDRRVYFTYSKNINSAQGAVLELETMVSFERPVTYRADRGYYLIEVKIYPGNRWNIMPRRFV